MRKKLFNVVMILSLSFLATSCYTLTYSVGNGSQTGVEITEKNHFLVYGLATIKTSDPSEMAKGLTDYDVTITHTFIDGLISALTGGMYTPTTTKIRK